MRGARKKTKPSSAREPSYWYVSFFGKSRESKLQKSLPCTINNEVRKRLSTKLGVFFFHCISTTVAPKAVADTPVLVFLFR